MAIDKREVHKGYTCPKCQKEHKFPAYLFAHYDEEVTHTCDCGARNDIIRGLLQPDKNQEIKVQEAEELAKEVQPATLPEDAEMEVVNIGTIDDGIDGSDQYVLLTRKDDDLDLDQAHNYLLGLYYRECGRPGGYFCTSVSVVHAAHSNNTVIATIHHRYDI